MWEGVAHSEQCHPGLVVLRTIRRQAKRARRQYSRPCTSSCFQAPFTVFLSDGLCYGTVSWNKPSPPELLLLIVFYPGNRNSKTMLISH